MMPDIPIHRALSGVELEPSMLAQHAPGAKLDTDKAPVATFALQYFPDALAAVAWVSEVGARKYTPWGWKKVRNGIERYTNALGRHLAGEPACPWDQEIDVSVAAQVAWNALARLQLMIDQEIVLVRRSRVVFEDAVEEQIENT